MANRNIYGHWNIRVRPCRTFNVRVMASGAVRTKRARLSSIKRVPLAGAIEPGAACGTCVLQRTSRRFVSKSCWRAKRVYVARVAVAADFAGLCVGVGGSQVAPVARGARRVGNVISTAVSPDRANFWVRSWIGARKSRRAHGAVGLTWKRKGANETDDGRTGRIWAVETSTANLARCRAKFGVVAGRAPRLFKLGS